MESLEEFNSLISDLNNGQYKSGGQLEVIAKGDKKLLNQLYFEEVKRYYRHLKKIRAISEANDWYWSYCSERVYKLTYEIRLQEFLNTYFDSNEKDFIKLEQDKIGGNVFRYPELLEFFNYSQLRKEEFLNLRSENFDKKLEINKSFTPFKAVQSFEILGILDYLKDQKGMNYQKQVLFIAQLIGKSEGNVQKEITNRRNIKSTTTKHAIFKRLKNWIEQDLLKEMSN